jgi:hypothetical protein
MNSPFLKPEILIFDIILLNLFLKKIAPKGAVSQSASVAPRAWGLRRLKPSRNLRGFVRRGSRVVARCVSPATKSKKSEWEMRPVGKNFHVE